MKKNIFFFKIIFFVNLFLLPAKSDDIFDLGKDIFLNKAVCSSCHSLDDAGSNAQIGPNLNEIRPEKMRVMTVVKNGIGVMPAYEGQLTDKEIEAVSHYVSVASNN
tara:strand:+ start:792 stop:1109 length:318 start_codon:yes stop_codon:yes gene_type:complete